MTSRATKSSSPPLRANITTGKSEACARDTLPPALAALAHTNPIKVLLVFKIYTDLEAGKVPSAAKYAKLLAAAGYASFSEIGSDARLGLAANGDMVTRGANYATAYEAARAAIPPKRALNGILFAQRHASKVRLALAGLTKLNGNLRGLVTTMRDELRRGCGATTTVVFVADSALAPRAAALAARTLVNRLGLKPLVAATGSGATAKVHVGSVEPWLGAYLADTLLGTAAAVASAGQRSSLGGPGAAVPHSGYRENACALPAYD